MIMVSVCVGCGGGGEREVMLDLKVQTQSV